MREYINEIIKPKVQGDGGEIDFVSLEGDILTVLLQGECSKCMIAQRCMDWTQGQILKDLNQTITIKAIRKKPFFWDV